MKIFVFMIITTVIMLMLEITSIATGNAILVPGVHSLLSSLHLVPGSTDVATGSLYQFIFGSAGILMIGIGAGIVAGFFTQSRVENLVILPLITGCLVSFIQTFAAVMSYSSTNFPSWISYIILIIFGPLTVGYVISAVEFFRGTD